MDKITQSITLDLVEISHNVVNARQGDRLTRDLIITITNNGKDYEIPNGSYVYLRGERADGKSVFYSAIIKDSKTINVEIHDYLLSCSGRCKLDIGIYNQDQSDTGNKADEIVSTESFILYVPKGVFQENDIVNSDEGSALSELINSAKDAIDKIDNIDLSEITADMIDEWYGEPLPAGDTSNLGIVLTNGNASATVYSSESIEVKEVETNE